MIKRIKAASSELEICRYFSDLERREDIDSHCVPILDDFPDAIDPQIHFIVMPLLRICNDPPFSFVDEVVEFVEQTLIVCIVITSEPFLY